MHRRCVGVLRLHHVALAQQTTEPALTTKSQPVRKGLSRPGHTECPLSTHTGLSGWPAWSGRGLGLHPSHNSRYITTGSAKDLPSLPRSCCGPHKQHPLVAHRFCPGQSATPALGPSSSNTTSDSLGPCLVLIWARLGSALSHHKLRSPPSQGGFRPPTEGPERISQT
jgi:hypothetical protein